MKENMKIHDSVRDGLKSQMEHRAPATLIDQVMGRIQQRARLKVPVPEINHVLWIAVACAGLILAWGLIPEVRAFVADFAGRFRWSGEGFYYRIPLVFWWSVMAIVALFYLDYFMGLRTRRVQTSG